MVLWTLYQVVLHFCLYIHQFMNCPCPPLLPVKHQLSDETKHELCQWHVIMKLEASLGGKRCCQITFAKRPMSCFFITLFSSCISFAAASCEDSNLLSHPEMFRHKRQQEPKKEMWVHTPMLSGISRPCPIDSSWTSVSLWMMALQHLVMQQETDPLALLCCSLRVQNSR